ncbi:MAG: hypothetical protein JWO86_2399, partial [Myxococcaceae bacterium]|nr:hypothetical protein [Myxococcaceae bacterium]
MPERAWHFADVKPPEAYGRPSLGEEPGPRAPSGVGLWRDGLASMHPAVEPRRGRARVDETDLPFAMLEMV